MRNHIVAGVRRCVSRRQQTKPLGQSSHIGLNPRRVRLTHLIFGTFLCCVVFGITTASALQSGDDDDKPRLTPALDGNQVQVPNSTIFKSTLRNFTSNPNRREDFIVGIGYDDSITYAQEVALKVLSDHPTVLPDPEPLVLVDNLGSSTVNLRVFFWFDGGQYSLLKVKSSVIRLVKRAFQDAGISMPDEAREVTFPNGVPVRMVEGERALESPKPAQTNPDAMPEAVSTDAAAFWQRVGRSP